MGATGPHGHVGRGVRPSLGHGASWDDLGVGAGGNQRERKLDGQARTVRDGVNCMRADSVCVCLLRVRARSRPPSRLRRTPYAPGVRRAAKRGGGRPRQKRANVCWCWCVCWCVCWCWWNSARSKSSRAQGRSGQKETRRSALA